VVPINRGGKYLFMEIIKPDNKGMEQIIQRLGNDERNKQIQTMITDR